MLLFFLIPGHHLRASVLLISQQLFVSNPYFRQISNNATYVVVFASPRNRASVGYLARQIEPSAFRSGFIIEAYSNCSRQQYGYLVLDFSQNVSELVRVRTNVWPTGEQPLTVFIRKQ